MSNMNFQPITLRSPQGATAKLYPYGGHLVSWQAADGRERIFTSANTELRAGAAIRGGVPIIFPQFANLGVLPKHGFARTAIWEVIDVSATSATLAFRDSHDTHRHWPHPFAAQYQVELGEDVLTLQLSITNTGDEPFSFTAALHTYLRVQEIEHVGVTGLHGLRYSDSAAGDKLAVQHAEELRIAGEVDRIYFSTKQPITVHEPEQRSMQCSSDGFADAVIWNPGAEKAATLADLEPEGYRRMLCIEAAAIGEPVTLAPETEWSGTQILSIKDFA